MNAYSKISTAALQGCDPAELGQLTATVERILPAIEEFWRYDGRTTRSIPSSTVIGGRLAIRPCYINPHTQLADVDTLVDHVTTIGDELTGTQSG